MPREAWGKTERAKDAAHPLPIHPLAHHSVDVAAVFARMLDLPIVRERLEAAAQAPLTEGMNLIRDPVLTISGGSRLSLPELMARMARGEVHGFPALRPHQRPAWHMFLVQLGALALWWTGFRDSLPTDDEPWLRCLRDLTPEHPGDEPWRLVVEDEGKPAFLQPPVPTGSAEKKLKWSAVETPDALDMLITSRNHDLKQSMARRAAPEDWGFALVSLQTSEGYGGAGNQGIARMNDGSSSRPMIGLAPARSGNLSVDPSAWWARDVRRLYLEPLRGRPPESGRQRAGEAPPLRRRAADPRLFPMPQAALADRRRPALAGRNRWRQGGLAIAGAGDPEGHRAFARALLQRGHRRAGAGNPEDTDANITAPVHVAHAFTVHAEESESDYFTAVDDLSEDEPGADTIQETELTSGLFYGYVVVDVPGLVKNLGGDAALAGESRRVMSLAKTDVPGAMPASLAGRARWAQDVAAPQ